MSLCSLRRPACALFVLCCLASSAPVKIRVDASRRATYTIPRTVFGTFLEPIGNSTYNGLWAEMLQNPSLEENSWSAERVAQMIHDEPALAHASQLGLPLPWEPLDPTEGNRYEPRWGHAANSWRSLAVFGVPGRPTGIKQQVYPAIPRERHYNGSLYAKHLSGPSRLDVSLRKHDELQSSLCHAAVEASRSEWQKYTFTLDLPAGQLRPLEPADFVVEVAGDERVELDELSLMPADAIEGLDPDIVRMSKEMHTPLVRFGGNFTSAYHWRDGIGPRDKRVSMLNIAWGIPETNQFGTDEFLRYCELIGAQPQIALNLGSGTAEEAAGWVGYVNEHWPSHGGLLWELGNELWGNWNLASPTLEELPGRTLRFSEAIRAVDAKARLIATGQDPDHFEAWNAAQLTNPAGTFNFLSTHFVVTTDRVAQAHATPDTIAKDAFAMPVGLGRELEKMQQQIDEKRRDRVHLAFTEWLWTCCRGESAEPDAPRWDNLGGAVTTAGFLNMLLQHAAIVPISDMTGIVEFAGIWKKHGRVFATPAYYAFKLYAGADIETPVGTTNDGGQYDVRGGVTRVPDIPAVPYLDVVAALNKAGDKLTLFCVNRHLGEDVASSIEVGGFRPGPVADIESLRGDSIYDLNSELEPDTITPAHSTAHLKGGELVYTFPRASVTRIELEK